MTFFCKKRLKFESKRDINFESRYLYNVINNKPDYYKIMGLAEKCSFEELKTQYRKLAMKHHPDKNPGNKESETLFKEINQAYSILSDPAKRAEYDVLRNSHFSSKHYEPFKDFTETMNNMFKQGRKEGQLSVIAELSLEQIELGSNFKFRYQGEIFNIQIPSGTSEGEVLMFTLSNGMGVEVTVKSKPHEYLERDGFDLFLDLPLTYGEIHQGVDLELQILGRRISIVIPSGLKFGTILRLKNQGLTSRTGVRGTIFVEVIPQHIDLSPDEIKQILKIEKKKEIDRPSFIFTKQIK